MVLDEFITWVQFQRRPVREADVARFEHEIGTKLPEDYRAFLLKCNGGSVGGELWFQGPTVEGKAADAGVHGIGNLHAEDSMSLQVCREVYEGRIPNGTLWIMDDPFGNAICLGLTGQQSGYVYFWDHELEPDPDSWDGSVETAGNVQLLTHSFSAFIAGLQPTSRLTDA
jgi:hypothetical protein